MMAAGPVKAVFFDLSGVLYEGPDVVPGAVETVADCRQQGLVLRFVTNTATRSRESILATLRLLGFELNDDELITAPDAAKRFLEKRCLKPWCLVHESIRDAFDECDEEDAQAVVIGDAREGFTYDSLDRAFRLCQAGALLVAIGKNRYFRDDSGLRLDSGAFVHALEWAAGVEAVVMGKPSAEFFAEVVGGSGCDARDCLMIGDDRECDVAAACAAGLRGALVRTGKFQAGDELKLPPEAVVIDTVNDCLSIDWP